MKIGAAILVSALFVGWSVLGGSFALGAIVYDDSSSSSNNNNQMNMRSSMSENDELALMDAWIHAEGRNNYGDPAGTMYMGGTPLFNERTGHRISRQTYIRQRHPDQPWLSLPHNGVMQEQEQREGEQVGSTSNVERNGDSYHFPLMMMTDQQLQQQEQSDAGNRVSVTEQQAMDTWLAAHTDSVNEYGDSIDRVYLGGTPLFDEQTGIFIDKYTYMSTQHPDKPWNNGNIATGSILP